jgi:uncharacterized protein
VALSHLATHTRSVIVAVTGSTGFIGSVLVDRLRQEGHDVRRVVRRAPASPDELRWDPEAGSIDTAGLVGVEAAVHLAGEGIADRRWTDEQKRKILESRTRGTDTLAVALASLDPRPSVLISGSAMGYYGDRGDEVLTESSSKGSGFLADVVDAWERATSPASDAGIRTAHLRSTLVLSATGGALGKMLPLFRFGVGGRIGSGKQWWPWITVDDEVGAIVHLLTADVEGPVNLGSPEPVTNAEFTQALGRAVHRPTLLPTPKFGPAALLGGELAEELLYTSHRVVPERLLGSGYAFRDTDLDDTLARLLTRA